MHKQLLRWENGWGVPTPGLLDALCALYGTRPDRLGFGHDYSDSESFPWSRSEETVGQGEFVSSAMANIGCASEPLARTEPLTDDGCVPDRGRAALAYVNGIEERTEQAGYSLYTDAPTEFIPSRMVDLAHIEAGLLSIRTTDLLRRLHRMFAKNAEFVAIRVMDVARTDDALWWCSVARRAARRADDATMEAWIAGHIGSGCACAGGSFSDGLEAAHIAQAANGRHPSAAAVFGYLAEADVQARMGRLRETQEAIRHADRMFTALPEPETVADGYHVTEYLLRWHQSNALTAVGAHTEADELRTRALELPFSRQDQVGQALLHLDDAASKVAAGELDSACQVIADVWDRLPSEYRIGWLSRRALQILNGVNPADTATREVRAIRDLLQSHGTSVESTFNSN
ncbi:hypothetical protein [Nocardia transvalensis]|uniref:hypothetical protein n=1 Tax=Nocardia transvalensis TaxID=37333 RepID=UPI001892E188|nr:hypothetical protein [Nocardia transvalensis]MBF6332422.1 hypothetical protein [Nocardia transvalensis]